MSVLSHYVYSARSHAYVCECESRQKFSVYDCMAFDCFLVSVARATDNCEKFNNIRTCESKKKKWKRKYKADGIVLSQNGLFYC